MLNVPVMTPVPVPLHLRCSKRRRPDQVHHRAQAPTMGWEGGHGNFWLHRWRGGHACHHRLHPGADRNGVAGELNTEEPVDLRPRALLSGHEWSW